MYFYYLEASKFFSQLSVMISDSKLEYQQIPFEAVINQINTIYSDKYDTQAEFNALYTDMISKAIEHKDRDELAMIFMLLSKHCQVFATDNSTVSLLKSNNSSFFVNEQYYKNLSKIMQFELSNSTDISIPPFTGKGVVYSAIIGNYDNVKSPSFVNPDLDYILFTDNPRIKSNIWDVRLLEKPAEIDNVRFARKLKILGHEAISKYDYSIWVDGKLEITNDLHEYIDTYRRHQHILCFNHFSNHDIYEEAQLCLSLKKGIPEEIDKQIKAYKQEGLPVLSGMIDSAVLVRDIHNEDICKLMTCWWEEICKHSYRDQLSFNYACWKTNVMYDSSDLLIYNNKYFKSYSHL